MNGKDFIAVLDYVKAFNKPAKQMKNKRRKDFDFDVDIPSLVRKKFEEAAALEAFWKEREKLNKKEEEKKKDEKGMRSFTFAEGVILAYLAQFVLGPLYNHYIQLLQVH